MKFIKEVNGKEVVIELKDANTFNIPLREGFTKLKEKKELEDKKD